MNNQQFTANRLRLELKPVQTQKLKEIAAHLGNDNLLHQINLMISSLHTALGLADNTDAKVTQT